MINAIDSAMWTAKSGKTANTSKDSGEFDAILQKALNNRSTQAVEPIDTFESSAAETASNRTAINRSRKLDEDGNPIEPKVQTAEDQEEYKKVFHQFVGQTLYGQMLKSMRETQQKPAYFDGGRAEEIFQGQLDQVLVDKMTAASSSTLSDTMFKLMQTSK